MHAGNVSLDSVKKENRVSTCRKSNFVQFEKIGTNPVLSFSNRKRNMATCTCCLRFFMANDCQTRKTSTVRESRKFVVPRHR